jgi:AraC-like DNA-binding protein
MSDGEFSAVDVDAVQLAAMGLEDHHGVGRGDWHAHRRHQVLYARSGAMKLEVEDRSWLLLPQRAAWIPARVEHRIDVTHPLHLCTVYLDPALCLAAAPSTRVFGVSPLAREMLLAAMEWGPEHPPTPTSERFFAALAALADRWAARATSSSLPRAKSAEVARAMRWTQQHLADSPTASDAARAAGLSARTLQRRFIAETGQTWGHYLLAARMLEAMGLLQIGATVSETAVACGYRSLGSFSDAFLRFTGVRPSMWTTLG